MSKIREQLIAGFIAAVVTGVIASLVIWKITASQHGFFAHEFAAQQTRLQAVGGEITKTANDLKKLDAALKTTEATLREVKDQVALMSTRNGIARLSTLAETGNKTLAEIKQATAADQTKAALAPLADKLDKADKALTALQAKLDDKSRDQALARVQATLAGVKDAIAKQPPNPELTQANAKLDEALKSLGALGTTAEGLKTSANADAAKLDTAAKSLNAISQTLDAIKSGVSSNASKLDQASNALTALKQMPQEPAKSKQDLVVFYVAIPGQSAAAPAPSVTAAPGLTPAVPPPLTVHFERLGKVDDEGQTALIIYKLRGIIKGHSSCTIAVAGHTDTVGGDRRNYELSKRRANEVADKLKAAFAAESIPVIETQWGERRLAEWTPDGVANEANRRVDIKVSCAK